MRLSESEPNAWNLAAIVRILKWPRGSQHCHIAIDVATSDAQRPSNPDRILACAIIDQARIDYLYGAQAESQAALAWFNSPDNGEGAFEFWAELAGFSGSTRRKIRDALNQKIPEWCIIAQCDAAGEPRPRRRYNKVLRPAGDRRGRPRKPTPE